MRACLKLSQVLCKIVDLTGRWAVWLFVPLIAVTGWDVLARKIVAVQIFMVENFGSAFESTVLQETEWHIHTALFCLVLGYGYTQNRHVRVDFLRERLSSRSQAWIEFIGATLFLLPFVAVTVYFAGVYAYESFLINEQSASLVGLPYRWLIKCVLVIGMILVFLSGVAVWLKCFVVLFGRQDEEISRSSLRWLASNEGQIRS